MEVAMSSKQTRPNNLWEVRWRDNRGHSRRKRFRTKEAALNFDAEVRHKKATGTYTDPDRAKLRFSEITDRWERSLDHDLKEKTAVGYRRILDRVENEFGRRRVADIEGDEVQEWIDELVENGAQPGTVRNNYRVLKMVLDKAVRDKIIPSNPAVGVRLPRASRREMLFLTNAQVQQLAQEVGASAIIVRFAAFTGLRAGEIAGLRVRDLNLKGKTATVRVQRSMADINGRLEETEPKTKAARRTVGIPAFVADELRESLGDRADNPEARVFVAGRSGDWRHSNWYGRTFRPAVKRLVEKGTWPEELADLRFHDLRHTFASFLVETGAHPKEMAEVMGHSTVMITLDRYSHMFPHLRDALTRRLDEFYKDVQAPQSAANRV